MYSKHGMTKSPEHVAWIAMKQRCCNPKHPFYSHYGGRGIAICQRWLCSFPDFFSDMGLRPSAKHTLDRIDNNGNYEPSNCRWATQQVQLGNRRLTIMLEHEGETLPLVEWSKRTGIPAWVLRYRVKQKWSSRATLSTAYLPHPKLTEEDVKSIRRDSRRSADIARQFHLHPSTVRHIKAGRLYPVLEEGMK